MFFCLVLSLCLSDRSLDLLFPHHVGTGSNEKDKMKVQIKGGVVIFCYGTGEETHNMEVEDQHLRSILLFTIGLKFGGKLTT